MKKIYLLLPIIIISISVNSFAGNNSKRTFRLASNIKSTDYFPGKIIVKIKPEYRSACSRSAVTILSLSRLMASLQTAAIEKKFPLHQPPVQQRNSNGQPLVDISLIYKLSYNASIPVEKAINILLQDQSVEYAEPEYTAQLFYTPNDTGIANEYQLVNIHAFQGWDISKGDTSIVIGITDTGTDTDHPDLVNQVKYNYADPINGIDDDGDGYVDNFAGWDLGDNDNDPIISIVHGSFVAGCAAAQPDNITGIAGSGFFCKYLPVKISSGSVLTKPYEGIVYAADHGCQIINCSWGSVGGGQFGQDIIDYATINQNRLVVCAAGNNNNDDPFFPASYKYVLSVTGTNSADVKWTGSSFGTNIDVSAPGEAVYSTIFDNYWSFSSGTSFASPIVAGLAGIVMWHFPAFTPLQVAEQLRATSDDIDGIPGNATYTHALGKGRVNLFRALTENAKSVRMIDINITDGNDNAFTANDTLSISGEITNWLDPVTNLNITLTCNSPDITIINGTVSVASMATLASTNNNSNPFTVSISPTIPLNSEVRFTLTYTDAGGYSDFQCFDLVLNVDYINILVNNVGTSITSKGRIGFNQSGQQQGIGFIFNDTNQVLYEGCFLAGINQIQVSDYMWGDNVNDHDFAPQDYVRTIIPSAVSDFDLYSTFNDDSAYTNKLNVLVTQRTFAWSTPADANYIMIVYTIKNNSSVAYDSLYASIYCDYDIGANASQNSAAIDVPLKLGYQWDTQAGGVYAAIKVLGFSPFNGYAVDNDGASGNSVNIYDGFQKAEKYISMSTPRLNAGTTGNGSDASLMVASGPYSINAGDSVQVGFALIAGDSLPVVIDAANAAEIKFLTSVGIPQNPSALAFSLDQNFPNPFSENTIIRFTLPSSENVDLSVYDITGQKVMTVVNQKLSEGKHLYSIESKKLNSGIYYFTLRAGGKVETRKLVKVK
ncbi:MAG: S8 family peptidase [Bacteroidia bacterium]